jgi:hypothetical protein
MATTISRAFAWWGALLVLAISTVALVHTPVAWRTVDLGDLHQLLPAQTKPVWRVGHGVSRSTEAGVPVVRMQAKGHTRFTEMQWLAGSLPALDYIVVRVEIRHANLSSNARYWPPTGVLVHNLDAAGKRLWFWPYQAISAGIDDNAERNWTSYVGLMPISADATRVSVIPYLLADTGFSEFRNLSISGAKQSTLYNAAFGLISLAWILATTSAAYFLVSASRNRIRGAITIALGGVLVAAGIAPQPHLHDTLKILSFKTQDTIAQGGDSLAQMADALERLTVDPVDENAAGELADATSDPGDEDFSARTETSHNDDTVPRDLDSDENKDMTAVDATATDAKPVTPATKPVRSYWQPKLPHSDKIAHSVAFAVLTMFACWAWLPIRAWRVLLGVATVSGSIQVLQYLQISREPDLLDFAADSLGAVFGLVLILTLRRCRSVLATLA